MRTRVLARLVLSALLVGLTAAATIAQAPAPKQSATEFYVAYRAAFDKATKAEDLLPYLAAENREQLEKTPAADRVKMFGVMKIMGTVTNLKVLKETPSATGATLLAEGLDGDKKKTTGQIQIVQEQGAWKVGKESWETK